MLLSFIAAVKCGYLGVAIGPREGGDPVISLSIVLYYMKAQPP
jgi:hypothetical protein